MERKDIEKLLETYEHYQAKVKQLKDVEAEYESKFLAFPELDALEAKRKELLGKLHQLEKEVTIDNILTTLSPACALQEELDKNHNDLVLVRQKKERVVREFSKMWNSIPNPSKNQLNQARLSIVTALDEILSTLKKDDLFWAVHNDSNLHAATLHKVVSVRFARGDNAVMYVNASGTPAAIEWIAKYTDKFSVGDGWDGEVKVLPFLPSVPVSIQKIIFTALFDTKISFLDPPAS